MRHELNSSKHQHRGLSSCACPGGINDIRIPSNAGEYSGNSWENFLQIDAYLFKLLNWHAAYPPNFVLDSNTVTDMHGFMNRWSIQELAETVNTWCRDRALQPANGQTASELSARTLHYYRSAGLLDAPESGAGRGYGRRHLLQLKAIRILQTHGLPLSRIQQLLFARSDEELEQIAESAGKIDPDISNVHDRTFDSKETWTTYHLNEQLFVVARNGAHLSTSQLEAIGKICDAPPKKSSRNTLAR